MHKHIYGVKERNKEFKVEEVQTEMLEKVPGKMGGAEFIAYRKRLTFSQMSST